MSDSAQTSAKLEFWDLNFEYIEVSLNDDKKCKFVHASAISETLQYEKLFSLDFGVESTVKTAGNGKPDKNCNDAEI